MRNGSRINRAHGALTVAHLTICHTEGIPDFADRPGGPWPVGRVLEVRCR